MVDFNKNVNILIIGGTGFIGQHVLSKAIKKKWNVVNISNKNTLNFNALNLTHYNIDILNYNELNAVISKITFNYVMNLSGYVDHTLYFNDNKNIINQHFLGLQNIIKSLKTDELKNFVQIGSSHEYGNLESPHLESSRENTISPYSFAKLANTHFLQMLNVTSNFPCSIARLYLPYGPGQNINKLIPQIINSCLNDKKFSTTDGNQIRDFCYIDDVVDGLFKILLSNYNNGEIFNIASGVPLKVRDVILKIHKIIGKGKPNIGGIDYRSHESMSCYADIQKIKNKIGWLPKITLDEGIKKTIDSYI